MITISSVSELKMYLKTDLLPQIKEKFPVVVLLSGEMGAGKTQLVKSFGELLKTEQPVTSPTFSIIQEYVSDLGTICHIDLYRIQTADELEHTGFWDIFNEDFYVIFIEWSEKMDLARIPEDWNKIKITLKVQGEKRLLTIA